MLKLLLRIITVLWKGWEVVVRDGQQSGRPSLLHHLLQGGQQRTDNTTGFLDEFIQSVGVLCLDAFKVLV